MGVIGSDKIGEALAKAKDIGLVEESFRVEGHDITLRNLRPDEYTEIIKSCEGLNDLDYLTAYQKGHIARSILEINGTDLRDVEFVEDERPDPKNPDATRVIKVELHDYLLHRLVNTWSREVLFTIYRKFLDVVAKAENKAKEGVEFLLAEETEEEKYRRLLLEAKECESDLPPSLVDHVLSELGYIRQSTAEELKATMERADQMARESSSKDSQTPPTPPREPLEAASPPTPPREPLEADQSRQSPPQSPPTQDPHRTLQAAIEARRGVSSSDSGRSPESEPATPVKRGDKIAALETGSGAELGTLPGPNGEPIPVYRPPNQEPMELRKQEPVELRKQEVDPQQVATILDQPPAVGINPRFNPPSRKA